MSSISAIKNSGFLYITSILRKNAILSSIFNSVLYIGITIKKLTVKQSLDILSLPYDLEKQYALDVSSYLIRVYVAEVLIA
jgi:hypothetical protein